MAWGSTAPVYDPAQARKLPYATLDAKVGKAAPGLVVLGEIEGDRDLHWFSADRAQLVTRNLRIIKTAGFPNNLSRTIWLAGNDDIAQQARAGITSRRQIDCPEEGIYGAIINASAREKGEEELDIYGLKVSTVKIEEENYAPTIDWSFKNHFWVDPQGITWQSEQHITPSTPAIQLKILKPYLEK